MRRRYFYDVYQITILKAEITEGKMKIAMIAVSAVAAFDLSADD